MIFGKVLKLSSLVHFVILTVMFVLKISVIDSLETCENKSCIEGDCVNGTCVCFPGWTQSGIGDSKRCDQCHGRISLTASEGIIYEGSGEAYPKDRMCSWLLDTHQPQGNVTVRFIFTQFETECGWDHLYVHDGDSLFAPMLAAYSGLLLRTTGEATFETSFRFSGRYGYLHFYSDAAYTMKGFNITYSVDGCPLNCSGLGSCADGVCKCDLGRTGKGCETDLCLNNCSDSGSCSNDGCTCDPGFKGADCRLTARDIVWQRLSASNSPSGRASHVSLMDGNVMWVIGGYSLSDNQQDSLKTYDIVSGVWQDVKQASKQPWQLYAHSAVMFESQLYVYGGVSGGVVTDQLWVMNVSSGEWTSLSGSGYPVSGHTAHVVGNSMLVFFGYSPVFGYMSRVQQYDFDTDKWSMVETRGSSVQGGYGHASVHDQNSTQVYVFGGYHFRTDDSSRNGYNLTDLLYAYDTDTKEWRVLLSSGHPRYLHSMVQQGDYLLVFGGNTHNDTSKSRGAKCFSADFMLYDIKCNSWHSMVTPNIPDTARFGHSMVNHSSSLYIFGGFDSVMLNDLIKVELGNCTLIGNQSECEGAVPGMRCVWDEGACSERPADASADSVCANADKRDLSNCPGYNTCSSCLNNSCTWCGNNCTARNCSSPDRQVNKCTGIDKGCNALLTCRSCEDTVHCAWDKDNKCKDIENPALNTTVDRSARESPCSKSLCMSHKQCTACTQNKCMWCGNMDLCIDTNAYVASFPYGQCMDWTTNQDECPAVECSGRKSCDFCLANSKCGWCNGVNDNGLGQCMDGSAQGPVLNGSDASGSSASASGAFEQCPDDRWFFLQCPACQCNGHSTCPANSSECESCSFPTVGDRCESCRHFYYGNPVNGGNCSECFCNGQADFCDSHNGHCICNTRGVTGLHCEKCDDKKKYFGDPRNGGTCFYRLSTDYQYTFNLSKSDDINFTRINFLSIPSSGDRDVDFTLNCSGFALLNITFKSKNMAEEKVITSSHECDYFRTKFEHKDYTFGGDTNTTFYVYIYDFKTNFWLQISFAQPRQLDLLVFFIVFFSCFLSLLLIAAALWKIKHKYDSYRRRQQFMVEMQQMASRPFSSVCLEIEKKPDPAAGGGQPERKDLKDHVDTALRRRKKLANKPSAIAMEPLTGNKTAVLTLLVQLPFGDAEFAPSGQSGLAVASALVNMPGTRKQSLEHIKGDKPKIRKNLLYTHPDTFA